jgi:hypothetical protein
MAEAPQPPKQDPKKNIFGGKEEAAPNIVADIAAQVNNVSRTLKTLEDKYGILRNKAQVTEQNMISNDKKIIGDIKLINSEIMDVKTDINDMKEKLTLLVKELKQSATKEEVKILEKYISYWEPLKFVTREELDKILDERKGK